MPTLPFLREANPVQGLVFRRGAANLANDPHMYATNDVTPTAVYPDEPNGSMAINPAGTASTMLSFMVAGSRVYVPMAGGAMTGTFDGIVGGTTPAAGTFTDLTSTGNTVLGNLATADTITATGRFNSDLVPSTNNARAFGTTALRWAAGWFDGLVTSGGGFSGVIGATGAANGSFTAMVGTSLDMNGVVDQDVALSAAGDGFNSLTTVNHATAAVEGLDVYAQAITTARTGGTLAGVQSTVTGLAGDTSGTTMVAYAAAVAKTGGSSVAAAFKPGAGFDAALDLTGTASGESDIACADAQASAFAVRVGVNVALQLSSVDYRWTYNLPFALANTAQLLADPGNAGAIPVTIQGGVCALTSAGAETRTLANPAFVGQMLTICCDVYGGDIVVTAAAAINVATNTIMTFGVVAESITLIGVRRAGGNRWMVIANDGVALS